MTVTMANAIAATPPRQRAAGKQWPISGRGCYASIATWLHCARCTRGCFHRCWHTPTSLFRLSSSLVEMAGRHTTGCSTLPLPPAITRNGGMWMPAYMPVSRPARQANLECARCAVAWPISPLPAHGDWMNQWRQQNSPQWSQVHGLPIRCSLDPQPFQSPFHGILFAPPGM